jgi:hypothetical protein
MKSGLNISNLSLRRIMIIAPVLTLGIHDDRERELNMQPGNIIVLSSSGDIERLTVLYAMIAARAS